jgi:hypothetical protein
VCVCVCESNVTFWHSGHLLGETVTCCIRTAEVCVCVCVCVCNYSHTLLLVTPAVVPTAVVAEVVSVFSIGVNK